MWVATAIIAGSVITGVGGYLAQKSAAEEASGAQREASQAAIAEQRRQQAESERLLAPYMQAGQGALGQQQALLGLAGPEAQRAAIAQLEQSPQFKAMVEQGETGILQNASATGGLRGGNTQAALAQFRPAMLSQLIQQQMAGLGGLSAMGQQGAMSAAGMGQQGAQNVMGQLGAMGQAQAGAAMAQGQGMANLFGGIGGALGTLGGLGAMGKGPFGGGGGGAAGNGYTPGMGGPNAMGMNLQLGGGGRGYVPPQGSSGVGGDFIF
jgi:hypothetical protein